MSEAGDMSEFGHWLRSMPEELRREVLPAERAIMLRRTCKAVRAILAAASLPEARVNAVVQTQYQAFADGRGLRDALAGLDVWCRVTVLRHGSRNMQEEGATELAGWLLVNGTLETLDLSYNYIGDGGAQALAQALRVNDTLRKLDLTYNGVGAAGAHALAEALRVNSTLRELNLDANEIGDEGAQALAETLHVNGTLRMLGLRDSGCGEPATRALAEALRVNAALETLDLGENDVRSGGACALAAALHDNGTLRELCLDKNNVGARGARALVEAQGALRTLDLRTNYLSADGASALADALRGNGVLRTLSCEFCAHAFFAPGNTNLPCEACPANKNTSAPGAASVTSCACTPGHGQEEAHDQPCAPCATGYFARGGSNTPCIHCGFGTVTEPASSAAGPEACQCDATLGLGLTTLR